MDLLNLTKECRYGGFPYPPPEIFHAAKTPKSHFLCWDGRATTVISADIQRLKAGAGEKL
jgi:hypothetical protein